MRWAQAELRSCSAHGAAASTKYQKCPYFGNLPLLEGNDPNFMMNHRLLISTCMFSIGNHSQSTQHDELQRKAPCSHHKDCMRTFDLGIPKCNLILREFPLRLGFQVPSFLSSHMSQCSSLSSFSSAARCASMLACMPMSIQLASKLHPHSDGSPNLFPSAVPITWELRGNCWEHGISWSSLDVSPS